MKEPLVSIPRQKNCGVFKSVKSSERGERKGFYIRPSAAIEKGGGFFIPGLEGRKLRIFISGSVIAFLTLNRLSVSDVPVSQFISEAVATIASVFLLIPSIYSPSSPSSSAKSQLGPYSVLHPRLDGTQTGRSILWAGFILLEKNKNSTEAALLSHSSSIVAPGVLCRIGPDEASCELDFDTFCHSALSALLVADPKHSAFELVDGALFEHAVALFSPGTTSILCVPNDQSFWLVATTQLQDNKAEADDETIRWADYIRKFTETVQL